jgi:hypothetical protein
METTPQGGNLFLETPLKAKPYQASRVIPRRLQWRLFTVGLVLSDLIMAGIAFRLAYFVRFELSLGIFYQNQKAGILFYQQVVLILIPISIGIFYLMGCMIARSCWAA